MEPQTVVSFLLRIQIDAPPFFLLRTLGQQLGLLIRVHVGIEEANPATAAP